MTEVVGLKTDSYDKAKENLQRSFEFLSIQNIIKPGDKVLIKPNLLKADPPEKAVTTHPAVVRALIELIRDLGAVPWVGDSSGGADYGNTARSLELSGILSASRDAHIKNFDTEGVEHIETDSSVYLRSVHIARPVVEADIVISTAKLKTHIETLYTGAVKNLVGCIPGSGKLLIHRLAPKPSQLSEVILDLYHIVKPELSVIDGVLSMEGDGPGAGAPRQTGLLFVGRDGIAVDAVASHTIGFDHECLHFLRRGEERGLGVSDISKITILGDNLEDLRIPDFKKPSNLIMRLLPSPLLKLLNRRFFWVRPEINPERCKECGLCEKSCPVVAISDFRIEHEKCIECFCCYEVCPHQAVEVKRSFLVRILSQ